MVGFGGVLRDENIHNLGSYGEGFGRDTIILGFRLKSAGLWCLVSSLCHYLIKVV